MHRRVVVAAGMVEATGSIGEERLLSLGSGPLPVAGCVEAWLTLDVHGHAVLIMALTEIYEQTAGQIADCLDRIATLSDEGLEQAAGGLSGGGPCPNGIVLSSKRATAPGRC